MAGHRSSAITLTRNPTFPFERLIWGLVLFFLLTAPVLVWLLLPTHDDAILPTLGARLLREPRLYFSLVATLAGFVWHQRTRHREQLRLDERGIHYTPPFSWWPQRGFSFTWSEIESLQLLPFSRYQRGAIPVLQIQTKNQTRKIWPLLWFPSELSWAEHRQRQRIRRGTDLAQAFAGCALAKQLTALGQSVHVQPGKTAGFDLFGNRASRAAVLVMFALLTYALADAMLAQQRYLAFTPWPLLGLFGVLAAVSMTILLRRFAVPLLEAIAVAALFAGALGLAGYSGLLRLNQFSDWDGSETVSYVRQANGLFSATGFPAIEVDALEPYWQQYPNGQHYSFSLYRGSLGFWQLDEAPVNAQMRAFYRARDQH
ncbi:hypothetical protein HPT27_05945 [Permianibacter sp. IMCC34836]|uniref:hypothetical protein n=1 Tax=Permianibacter fluminis TaxID=2738515 RepID=UPI0015578AAF|nr:hypothetical protein [Permianibacter fluminis]NQD36559.1 hypothetical protein [Permianibacter fluminis]